MMLHTKPLSFCLFVLMYCFMLMQNSLASSLSFDASALSFNPQSTGFGSFDDNYVNFGDAYDLTQTLTISIWIKPQLRFNPNTVFSKKRSGLANSGYAFYINEFNTTNGLMVLEGQNSVATSTSPVVFNEWQHIVWVLRDGAVQLYYNGIEQPLEVVGDFQLTVNEIDFRLGQFAAGAPFNYKGSIDELRIWERALDCEEVYQSFLQSEPVNNTTDLLAHYDFNHVNQSDSRLNQLVERSQDGVTGQLRNFTFSTDELGQVSGWTMEGLPIDNLQVGCLIYPNELRIPATGTLMVSPHTLLGSTAGVCPLQFELLVEGQVYEQIELTNADVGKTIEFTVQIGDEENIFGSCTKAIPVLRDCIAADAGPSENICSGRMILRAKAPLYGIGEWSFVSNPNSEAKLENPNSPNAIVSTTFPNFGVQEDFNPEDILRTFILRWTVTDGDCVSYDDVIINFIAPLDDTEGLLESGRDVRNQCRLCGTSATLSTPLSNYPGYWTFVSNPGNTGSFAERSAGITTLTGVFGGIYVLKYTVTRGEFANQFYNVVVSFSPDIDLPGGQSDGTQDCLDLCLGRDDRINTDQTGMPDGCDCNPTAAENEFVTMDDASVNLLLASEYHPTELVRHADFAITSDATIPPTDKAIVFKAGNSITLSAGFNVSTGTTFSAVVEYCEDPLVPINNLEDDTPTYRTIADTPSLSSPALTQETILSIYPNVVRQTANLQLMLPKAATVTLQIVNQNGQLVATPTAGEVYAAGVHEATLSTNNLPPGLYLLYLRTETAVQVKKFIIQP